jgi:quinohemoprotein ethanol dehydrogenase
VDPRTGRAAINPAANYTGGPRLVYPSMAGGHNWNPMAFNPQTGLVYIPVIDAPMIFVDTDKRPIGTVPGTFNVLGLFPEGYDPKALAPVFGDMPPMADLVRVAGGPKTPQSKGFIRAFDPVAGKVVWQAPTTSFQDGGVMTSAGNLVISGDLGGWLSVRRADTGALVKRIFTGTSIMAAPMTYKIGDTQYVAVLAGLGGAGNWTFAPDTAAAKYGNAARLLAFRIDGGAVPIPAELPPLAFAEPPAVQPFTPAQATAGEMLYTRNCAVCHGFGRGLLPDLRRISNETHGVFNAIVLEGLYVSKGMGNFSDTLKPAEVDAIHAFVSREQQTLYKAEAAAAADQARKPPKITH